MAYNYLKKKNKPAGSAGNANGTGPKRVFVRQAPDETVHTAPGAMYIIGGIGTFSGFAANIWQMVTTFTAFWFIFNPPTVKIDLQKQPTIFCICALIAFSFQFALTMLTWRLDTTWKKQNMRVAIGGGNSGADKVQAMRNTAVEMIQHVNLVLIWGALGFIVDTIGDYTFIQSYTAHLDAATQVFVIFIYAVALYALSTIAFVRSIEYITAGFAAAHNLLHHDANSTN
jgi:hypothetical protein